MGLHALLDAARDDAKAMAGFQSLISRCPTAPLRKELIVTALCCGAIDQLKAELLLQAYQLEAA